MGNILFIKEFAENEKRLTRRATSCPGGNKSFAGNFHDVLHRSTFSHVIVSRAKILPGAFSKLILLKSLNLSGGSEWWETIFELRAHSWQEVPLGWLPTVSAKLFQLELLLRNFFRRPTTTNIKRFRLWLLRRNQSQIEPINDSRYSINNFYVNPGFGNSIAVGKITPKLNEAWLLINRGEN